MQHKIIGDDVQAVILGMNEGDTIRAEAGAMMYMTTGIEMKTQAGEGKGNGVMGALLGGAKRMIAGESFFSTTFTATQANQQIGFAAPYPGKIIPLNLAETGPMLCQRDAYLCGDVTAHVEMAFTKKLGAGFFGGEGFVLQKLHGEGTVFIHSAGGILPFDLVAGQSLKVDTGCLVGMSETVTYDIQMMTGIKNVLFAGEGLFFAYLTGPGRVYLQTLPFGRMADRIIAASKLGSGRDSEQSTGVAGLGGKILGNILSGQ